jgi:hypothetical protein
LERAVMYRVEDAVVPGCGETDDGCWGWDHDCGGSDTRSANPAAMRKKRCSFGRREER